VAKFATSTFRARRIERQNIEDILSFYVRSNDGDLVQVSQFAEAELSSAPPVISHYNLNRTVIIQGAEAIGKSSGQALSKIQQLFNAQNFTNIGSAFTGLAALQLSAGNASILVFGLGVLIVYLVLSAQYESYITPSSFWQRCPWPCLVPSPFWRSVRLI
jgi:multidrug efflux pump subunit AcrB